MTYLLVKILVLLALAALFGAWLAWWWLRRQFEDVSVEYTRLTTSSASHAAELSAAKESLDAAKASAAAADARAAKLDGERAALQARVDADAAWRAKVEGRLDALKPADLGPALARLDAIERRLEGLATPDPAPLLARLDAVDKAVAAGRGPELSALLARLGDVERAVKALKPADHEPVLAAVAALAATVAALKPAPAVDFAPLLARLSALDAAVAAVEPAPAVDLGPLVARLTALEARVGAARPADLSPVVSRLAALEARVTSLHTSDATLVIDRLTALEHRVTNVRIERVDLAPVLDRLAALEALVRGVSERPPPPSGPSPIQLLFLSHHRAGGGRNLLTNPVFGEPDDLLRIVGVGPVLLKLLHELGVYYFWQVADWAEADVEFVNSKLEVFKGRIERERWVEQSKALAAEPGAAKRPELGSLA